MAHYNASVDTPSPPDEVFAYLSDFSSTEEWDPGVVEAERVGDAPVGEGTEFRLVAEFLGRRIPLTYRIIDATPPNAVTFPRRELDGRLPGPDHLSALRHGHTCHL